MYNPDRRDELTPMAPEQVEAVARMLAAAFLEDPGYSALFAEAQRERALVFLFTRLLRLRLNAGATVRVLGGREPIGALCWAPSQVGFGMVDYVRQGLIWAPLVLGPAATRRMLQSDSEAGALRRAYQPLEPHAWISQLGVHPDHRRRGLGQELMRATLAEIDAQGLRTALMTTHPDLPAWYARFGFQVVGAWEMQAGFSTWFLVRPVLTLG
jgi:ribosomal protein S18 acetylase RimI-like enzyme